ncbi:MAG: trans-sulfuration enzyme family protein [Flavobacteriales bacterium]
MKKETAILNSIPIDPLTGAISVPIYQTATFVQEAPGQHKGFDYGRSNNPTRQILEEIVAQLENGIQASAFATGLAAIDAVVKTLQVGDEILAVDDIYGGAYRLFTKVYAKLGIKVNFVDTQNLEAIKSKINDKTKLIWLETPTNPLLKISDIRSIAQIAAQSNCRLVVDNTFAGPLFQNPLDLGADFVIHSATKYLAGHSDLVGGIVVTKDPELAAQIKFIQNSTGAILGPFDAFLCIRGIETLHLRFEKQSQSALKIANYLAAHPAIDQIYYPGLSQHQLHDLAQQQQSGNFGGVLSFSLKDDQQQLASKLVTKTQLFKLAESLGGVKSLICQPALMTHASVPREVRIQRGIQDSLIRLSVGIEHADDLILDLQQAFEQL